MAYRDDVDLRFLGEMPSQDLTDLVNVLIKDKDGSKRLTEELSSSDAYKKYAPQHAKYWKEIAAEIQCFGANSLATLFRRGKGVLYREVLIDACSKAKVNFNEKSEISVIEDALLMKLLADSLEKMTDADRQEIAKIVGLNNLKSFSSPTVMAALQGAFVMGGFASYQIALMIANAVSRSVLGAGIALAGNAALARGLSIMTGPIGWALTGIWTAVDLAGPAFRVTLPTVVHVALLRKQHQAMKKNIWGKIKEEFSRNH